jgi:tRNA threonylcarbamoyladenosine biosynthesis protein TsaE
MTAQLQFTTHNVAETVAFGTALGALLERGDVVCLSGDLGAGKTALARGIAAGWGVREAVNSPTYIFIHEYERHGRGSGERLYHVDAYRLTSAADAASIGLEDLLAGEGVVLLEWPERVLPLLPTERLWIDIETPADADQSRQFSLEVQGTDSAHFDALLATLARQLPPSGELAQ